MQRALLRIQGSTTGRKAQKKSAMRDMALNYHWRYTKHQLAEPILRAIRPGRLDRDQFYFWLFKNI
ncbi:hypothetical protein [Chitinolyticbacter meiyuanensis]|uniref:hypothetical protein n=1 Tax=Chitinolyticbacter meiyuanensis TaxID=682798 RepID=UPI0011E59A81|nr:hypothetical protein [Chitinolyticbacter meiyuanensis]